MAPLTDSTDRSIDGDQPAMKRISLFALFLVIFLTAGLYFSGERLANYVEAGLHMGEQDRFGSQVDRVEEALRQDEQVADYVKGQVLIRFKKTVTREQISDFYAEYGLAEKDNLDSDPNDADQGLRLAAAPVDVDENLIEVLESDARVAYAEPNYLLQLSETPPSDPLFERLWGLHNTGQTGGTEDADIDALEAWEISAGSKDVILAVIDNRYRRRPRGSEGQPVDEPAGMSEGRGQVRSGRRG